MPDHLISETLDFAEKIVSAASEPTDKRLIGGQLIHRGMFFLSTEAMTAALRLLNSSGEKDSRDAFCEFVMAIRKEIGVKTINKAAIDRLLGSTHDIAKPDRHGKIE